MDIRDPYERAKLIEQSRRESAEMRADMERRRNSPDHEPIRRPLVEKSGEGAVIHRDYQVDATADAAAAGETDWSGWERWMEGHKALLREEILESVAKAIVIMIEQRAVAPLEKKIRALERKLVRKSRR
jgi:hypothetical protein